MNERCVELAVAHAWMDRWAHHRLEVGNVLGHYPDAPPRTVVDRYEEADGVINCDVFDIGGRWDEIVAISTMEHVRWDEGDHARDPSGAQRAIEHLRSLLAPGGRMLVTIPTGHHPHLDEWLRTDAVRQAANPSVIVRDGTAPPHNGWVESTPDDWRPYPDDGGWADAVWIGEFLA